MKELRKANRLLWLFGMFKIPLIGFVRPRILEFDANRMVIKIKLRRRTRNHLGSMYFGALGIGADLAGAFQAFSIADEKKRKYSIAFKDFKADFLKRPEADVYFVSEEGNHISEMMDRSFQSGERVTENVKILGITDYFGNSEVVAEFELGLSVKYKP